MSQPTLILSPRHTDSSQALWRAAIEKGWEVERLSNWKIPSDFKPPVPVIYGEPLFNKLVAEHLRIELPEPPENFLTLLPEDILGRKVTYTRAYMARRLEGPHFIKPPNSKTFKAAVYESGAGLPPDVTDNETVLVQDIVSFRHEYRLFFMGERLAACSSYMIDKVYAKRPDGWVDPPEIRKQAIAYGKEVGSYLRGIRKYPNLVNSVVLDVGFIEKRGWFVVEANEINASGIYNADPFQCLLALCWATSRTLPDPYRAGNVHEIDE